MRNLLTVGVAISLFICGMVHAETSTDDEVFATAALRELHNLAVASAKSAQATKDGDDLGCQYENKIIQEAAHEALNDMHYMSLSPIDAIEFVSTLLRFNHLAPSNGCSFDVAANMQPITAGQAIMALRWDYAIGNGDWYIVKGSGDVEGKNPLRYAKSLREQNYSWVGVRPKDMIFVFESDWKSELASHRVDDPSIEYSGNSLLVVEVDYRKNSDDKNSTLYFYRTKESAVEAARVEKNRSQADEERREINAEWSRKLTGLPYMTANRDGGFKLIYTVCRAAPKNGKGENTCNDEGSYDWSDDLRLPYRWFSDMQECENAQLSINANHPSSVRLNTDDIFTSDCVPAPKVIRHALTGYQMVVAITAPDSMSDDASYANLRDSASQVATVFKTFGACSGAINSTYSRLMKNLGVDEDGNLLSDKTKSVGIIANCVRVY